MVDSNISLYIYTVNRPPQKGAALLFETAAPYEALVSDLIQAVEIGGKGTAIGGNLFIYDIIEGKADHKPLDKNKTIADYKFLTGDVLLYSETRDVAKPSFAGAKPLRDYDEY